MPMPAKLPRYQEGGLVSGPGTDYSSLWRRQAEANNRSWDAVNQQNAPAKQQVMHRIAPPAENSNAQRIMAQIMSQSTPNAGSALGKMANAWVAKYRADRETENKRQYLRDHEKRRGGWASMLHGGATLRDIATHDPGIMGDAEFLNFAKSTTPEIAAEVELFEDVQNPYGRGGVGQRSSTTGKISGYQGPVAAPAEQEIFETVNDPFGRGGVGQRSSTSGKISGYQGALATPVPPSSQGPSEKDQLSMTRQLSDDWMKTARPMQGLLSSSDRMNIGFEMAKSGDMLAGSQAILISFNKLLDPTSVVRESEYARSATGQSALETLKGMAEKLKAGGAGVTLKELDSYRRFGEEVVRNSLESTVGPERKRISRLADRFGVDPELIFSGRFAPQDAAPQAAPEAMPQTAPPQAPMAQALEPELASTHAMMAPTGEAGVKIQPDPKRVEMYAGLQPDALRRQAATMQADPSGYSEAEKRAMSAAWFEKFGE